MDNLSSPNPHFQRSEGLTPSEKILKRLGDRSFLSLWCYPNIYRDQGGGKEVCDLLVVFENHILIFSDKDIEFRNSGNLELDWKRWFHRAIEESAKQIWGAERWIMNHPDRLFLDSACTQPFPIDLPDPQKAQFHRILVTNGASKRGKAELGSDGSLILNTSVIGNDHKKTPFTIGHVDPTKGFIHIFDESSLKIVMQNLDTISDFVTYLTKKEYLIQRKKAVYAPSEKELLAVYLREANIRGEHDFPVSDHGVDVYFKEGLWEQFSRHPQRVAQLKANEVSYTWDRIIEQFNTHLVAGTQHFTTDPSVTETEKGLRFLAKESRFERRNLSIALLDLIQNTPTGFRNNRLLVPIDESKPYYIFVVFPPFTQIPWAKTYDEYRDARLRFLHASCKVVKLLHPLAVDIIGIATESDISYHNRSEDFIYLDARIWTEEANREARLTQQKLGILTDIKAYHLSAKEYPDVPLLQITRKHKIGRNDLCPCGSRKKYKHCCLGKT